MKKKIKSRKVRKKISQIKRNDDLELLKSRIVKNLIYDTVDEYILIQDTKHKIIWGNRAASKVVGFKPEQLKGKYCYRIWCKADKPVKGCPVQRALKTGRTQQGEIKTPNGKYWFIKGYPIKSKNKVIGTIINCYEITDKKKIEIALKASEKKYKIVLDMLGDNIHIIDRKFNIIMFNKGFRSWNRKLKLQTDTIGKNLFELFPFLPKKVKTECNRVFRTGKVLITEELTQIGKRIFYTETRKIPVFKNGKVTEIITKITDITDQKKIENKLKENVEKLKKLTEEIIHAMALTVETRDLYTAGHQKRVATLATTIAKEMKLSKDKINSIKMASLIHDIGKIYIPAEILSKPSTLSDIEFKIIKNHPHVGYEILKNIDFPWQIAKIVLQHHERMDGSGYPQGIKGKSIMLESRILAVADVVEAMTFFRPYRSALGIDKALEEIRLNRKKLYDSKVVDACIKLFKEKKFSFK